MRKQLLWSLFFSGIFALGSPGQEAPPESRLVDLRNIGYPQGDCRFPNAELEFLDSVRLLVSFPLYSSSCNGTDQTEERRAVVVNVNGEVLKTLNLQHGQLVRAGPNGRILFPTEKGLRILGGDFSELQMLPWPEEAEAGRIPFQIWARTNIHLTPSRDGFAIGGPYPDYGVAYFEGDPVKLVTAISSCSSLRPVTDGGFGCLEQSPKNRLVVHLVNGGWDLEDFRFGDRESVAWAAFPVPDRLLLLTSKFKLYELRRGRNLRELGDLHWLAPGLWSSGSTYTVTSGTAHRILVSSWGCWFPITDTTGIGYYKRILVLDYLSGAIIFRKKSSIGSDVAISPNGHLLAIRENNRLSLVVLR
jgi:hypothetical protein